jgi:hypothetical protein
MTRQDPMQRRLSGGRQLRFRFEALRTLDDIISEIRDTTFADREASPS